MCINGQETVTTCSQAKEVLPAWFDEELHDIKAGKL